MRIHRPHARQNHRGIQQRINPRKRAQTVIPQYANAERDEDERHGDSEALEQSPNEQAERQDFLVAAFKHGRSVAGWIFFALAFWMLGPEILRSLWNQAARPRRDSTTFSAGST
jgi:hypothetical protein